MPELLENRYRDFLAEHLELISQGLTLVDTELKLPNQLGAKGFVDLVAKDQFGVYVLIEIKRSDSAARNAMHELFKYTTLFREQHGLAGHQLRCILLSTTWHELLAPFSELLENPPFQVEGRELLIGQDGNPSETRKVETADLKLPLHLCPKHELFLYNSSAERASDIPTIEESLKDAGVTDYFLFHLDHGGVNPEIMHPYALYLILAELSSAQRSAIERDGTAHSDEIDDEDYDEQSLMDASTWEHEETVFVWVNRASTHSSIEIGYPDKLRNALHSWRSSNYVRAGRFGSEIIWSDDLLLSAALSEGEQHTDYFTYQVSTSNGLACERLLSNVSYTLLGTAEWEQDVPSLLKHLISDPGFDAISVRIYSPCDILFGLSGLAAGRIDYLPALEIVAQANDGAPMIYTGSVVWDRKTSPPNITGTNSCLPHGIEMYRLAQNFGEQWSEEARLCRLHGFRYALYEIDLDEDSIAARVRMKKSKMQKTPTAATRLVAESLPSYARKNHKYIRDLHTALRQNAVGLPF